MHSLSDNWKSYGVDSSQLYTRTRSKVFCNGRVSPIKHLTQNKLQYTDLLYRGTKLSSRRQWSLTVLCAFAWEYKKTTAPQPRLDVDTDIFSCSKDFGVWRKTPKLYSKQRLLYREIHKLKFVFEVNSPLHARTRPVLSSHS